MKLNCDMGESYGAWRMGAEAEVMPWVDQANIACGFHAGDPHVMVQTIKLAQQHNVQIGAHPGYNDKLGFGRRSIAHSDEQITQLVCYQIGALDALCALHGQCVEYVKPHGALYNDMMDNINVFAAIVTALASYKAPLALMILARPDLQAYQQIADKAGIRLLFEAFADRAYDKAGYLVSRSEQGAVLSEATAIKKQVQQIVTQHSITSINGNELKMQVDSICVHGDNPVAILLVEQLQQLLSASGKVK